MSNDNRAFAYLIRNDIRSFRVRARARRWVWFYFAAIAAILIAVTAIWGGVREFKPGYLLYVCFGFPFAVFGISFSMLKREWSNDTYGWWLTLPHSRFKLLFAKLVASAAMSAQLLLVYFGGVLLLEAFNVITHGLPWHSMKDFVALEGEYLLVIVLVSPFMMTLGLLASSVARTKLKPLLPLVWITFGLVGNLFSWLNNAGNEEVDGVQGIALFSGTNAVWFWALIPVAWLLAALLFAGTVRVLSKHLDL